MRLYSVASHDDFDFMKHSRLADKSAIGTACVCVDVVVVLSNTCIDDRSTRERRTISFDGEERNSCLNRVKSTERAASFTWFLSGDPTVSPVGYSDIVLKVKKRREVRLELAPSHSKWYSVLTPPVRRGWHTRRDQMRRPSSATRDGLSRCNPELSKS